MEPGFLFRSDQINKEEEREKRKPIPAFSLFDVIHQQADEFHYVGISQEGGAPIAQMVNSEDSRLHPSMDDQEMEEIRSIGEQHEMEWNDSLNLATSAWWFKFLKAMEIEPDEKNFAEDYGCYPFDEVMEFPPWFNPNETCLQHVDDTYSHPTLPCMDIEEIEGMDVEWLA